MRRPSQLAARLRRQLLAMPAFTPKPVCPGCGQQVEATALTRLGLCVPCEVDHRAAWEQWTEEQAEAVRDAAYGDLGLPEEDVVSDPGPFLPDHVDEGR
jgi:hypothetical protein